MIAGVRSAAEVEANAALVARRIPAAFWDDLKAERLILSHAPCATPEGP